LTKVRNLNELNITNFHYVCFAKPQILKQVQDDKKSKSLNKFGMTGINVFVLFANL